MADAVQFLDQFGRPMDRKPSRASMLAGNRSTAYDAANMDDPNSAPWTPYLGSPDLDLNPWRNVIVARMRDQIRNDGWSSGILTRLVDTVLGPTFRPSFKPDFLALARYTGNKAFDAVWAREYAQVMKGNWRNWSQCVGHYNDVERKWTTNQQWRTMFRHKLSENDALAVLRWKPDRVGPGRARYATCLQVIDPDRLSNPGQSFDQRKFRGGVELDADLEVPVAYHIRKAHPGDWFSAAESVTWERVERETAWGRPIVVHDFNPDRASQHRGGAGILAPVLQKLKNLFKYEGAELDAALINAIFAAFIESPFDHDMLGDALTDSGELSKYQTERSAFHEERRPILNTGARVSTLFPGEKFNFASAERPNGNYGEFVKVSMRNIAACAGMSTPEATNDWSDVNYSSFTGALNTFWRTYTRERVDFGTGCGQPVVVAFMEESHAIDDIPLPRGAPPFIECRTEYTRSRYLGPGRGWLNPIDEPAGSILRMEGSLTTLERELADQGEEFDEIVAERKAELDEFKAMGLTPPSWATAQAGREQANGPKQDANA